MNQLNSTTPEKLECVAVGTITLAGKTKHFPLNEQAVHKFMRLVAEDADITYADISYSNSNGTDIITKVIKNEQ